MAIADVFDALTSDRVYRPAMTIDQAVAILREGRGTHFDPVLLDHFLNDLHDVGAERHAPLDGLAAEPARVGSHPSSLPGSQTGVAAISSESSPPAPGISDTAVRELPGRSPAPIARR